MIPKISKIELDIFATGFDLISQKGWGGFNIEILCSACQISAQELPDYLDHKQDFLTLIGRVLTYNCASELPQADLLEETPKNRLLEWILLRFEQLEPYKAAVILMVQAIQKCPKLIRTQYISAQEEMRTFYLYGGLPAKGFVGEVSLKGSTAIYLWTMRWWVSDSSHTMESVMAYLDKKLTWADHQIERYT